MLELVGRPAFMRFLFTVAQKAGIAASAYGSNLDTSSMDGRRSLGIDILARAGEGRPGRDGSRSPVSGRGAARAAMNEATPMETSDEAEDDLQEDEHLAR